jgi:predicted anti-sigma-YlaC factor YlaD
MPIKCSYVKQNSTAYTDGRLQPEERSIIAAHLHECQTCATHVTEINSVRAALHRLPVPVAPEKLKTALQVIASRERAAVVSARGSRWQSAWEYWKFRVNEWMRPLAIPATGGIISSLILFGSFILTIGTTKQIVSYEIPVAYTSVAEASLVPIELRSHAVTLNMSIDGKGRVDYMVEDPACNVSTGLQAQSAAITMPVLPTVFAVAHPISGDIQIKFLPLAFRQ